MDGILLDILPLWMCVGCVSSGSDKKKKHEETCIVSILEPVTYWTSHKTECNINLNFDQIIIKWNIQINWEKLGVAPCWVMDCVCMWRSMLQLEESKKAEEEEEEGKGGRGEDEGSWGWGSNRGKAFGCCSNLSSPQWAGKERKRGRCDAAVAGWKGNRLVREIEKEH